MTIEQRVEKLERKNRWTRRGGGLALATVACVVPMGFTGVRLPGDASFFVSPDEQRLLE